MVSSEETPCWRENRSRMARFAGIGLDGTVGVRTGEKTDTSVSPDRVCSMDWVSMTVVPLQHLLSQMNSSPVTLCQCHSLPILKTAREQFDV